MLATQNPRKPAWALARGRMRVRLCTRTDAFGNALGGSLVESMKQPAAQPPGAVFNWDDADMDGGAHETLAQQQRASEAAAAASLGRGLRLGGGQGLRFSGSALNDWSNEIDGGIVLTAQRDAEIDAQKAAELAQARQARAQALARSTAAARNNDPNYGHEGRGFVAPAPFAGRSTITDPTAYVSGVEESRYDKFSKWAHIGLSTAGVFPVLGVVPDAIDWVYTAAEIPFGKSSGTDLALASLGIAGTVAPVVGDGAAAALKTAARLGKHGDEVATAAAKSLPSHVGGTGAAYDKVNGQGLYVLRNEAGEVKYLGRGDAPARLDAHTYSADKKGLVGEVLWGNNLSTAQAKGLEQGLMTRFGGAISQNPNTPLLNRINSYSPTNPNASTYSGAATEALLGETLRRLGGTN
jgi:hypothetical protein